MILKFTSNNDFDFPFESVSLLTDSTKQLVKRASAKHLLKYEKNPKQEDLHIIALGAFEGTGLNRNADGFLERDCRNNHHYFKRADRAVHRHHKNKPTDPKFGNIKAAAYNEAMKRVELIVGLDRDKCADILHEQETTGNTNWSMASKQAYDVCTWCGHKAKTDKDRCACIPKNLGEINEEGEVCGMMNPDPKWFEISYVKRPADRIGMSLGKMASDSTFVAPLPTSHYLSLYHDIYVPEDVYISKKAEDKRYLIAKLAELEKHLEGVARSKSPGKDLYLKRHAASLNSGEALSDDTMDELRKYEPGKLLKALADKGIIFSPEDFSRYVFGGRMNKDRVEGMKSHLPDIFSKLNDDRDESAPNNEKYEPQDGQLPQDIKKLISHLTEGFSMFGGPAVRRIMRITIMNGGSELKPTEKEKTKEASDYEFAKQYASYKLAMLNYLNENNKLDEDVLMNSIIQNRK